MKEKNKKRTKTERSKGVAQAIVNGFVARLN